MYKIIYLYGVLLLLVYGVALLALLLSGLRRAPSSAMQGSGPVIPSLYGRVSDGYVVSAAAGSSILAVNSSCFSNMAASLCLLASSSFLDLFGPFFWAVGVVVACGLYPLSANSYVNLAACSRTHGPAWMALDQCKIH